MIEGVVIRGLHRVSLGLRAILSTIKNGETCIASYCTLNFETVKSRRKALQSSNIIDDVRLASSSC